MDSMAFSKKGTRAHTVDFEILDEKERDELLSCIKENGKLSVRFLVPGQVLNGKVLTESYERLID
jgi:hypothetical protein